MRRTVTDSLDTGTWIESSALKDIYAHEQRLARYPDLFLTPAEAPLLRRVRSGTGLVSMAIQQRSLTTRQRAALGVFRLQQFALCGWYDLAEVRKQGLLVDPMLAHCPDATVHILVGAQSDYRVLAYFCLQAAPRLPDGDALNGSAPAHTPHIGDPKRPLFPTEYDQSGPDMLASLPALAALPMDRVYELTCLLSNRALTTPLSFAALIEGFYSMSCLARDPQLQMDAIIGHVDVGARRVVRRLGVPVLYAPLVPPIHSPQDILWTKYVLEHGRFWPFVIATEDLHDHANWFARLDIALEADEAHLKRALVDLLGHPEMTRPQAFVPLANDRTSPYFWTDDPLFGDSKSRDHESSRLDVADDEAFAG
jgi:hypothetical protein